VSESFFSDATKQWQALMQQSAGPWSELLRAGAQSPDAFEQWSSAFRKESTPAETIERFMQGARDYVAFMQSTLGAAGAGQDGMSAWLEPLKRAFASQGMAGAMFNQPFAKLWPAQHAPGVNPFAATMPFNLPAQPANLQELKSWLSLPAFGLLREHQERQQKAAVAWVEYQEQAVRHNEQMLKAARRGFELFEGKLAEREQPGRQIESLRALYDLWVDAAEEGYAEVALSEEYREAYGALVNAQMRMRAQVQQEIERVSADLGMPTRGEIDSIGQRLQALRREVRGLRGGDALVDEIAELRSELDALVRNTVREALGEKTDVPRPATPRKRATPGRARAAEPGAKRAATKKKAAPRRAAAAVAPGGFATRIAQFADASLGGKRKARKPEAAPAKAKRAKTKQ